MSVDFTKPVQTRDGRKVRILCTDRRGGLYPVLGLVMDDRGIESSHCWTLKGELVVGEIGFPNDLINVPPPKKKAKLFVELRLDREGRDLYGVAAVNRPAYKTENIVLASTTIELEYEEQP